MATENKVQFGLKNVHYAVMGDDGSYETPVAVTGAVSLSLDAEGDTSTFYADNSAYYVSVANNGYSGDLEMARFPDQMLQDVWGYTLGTENKVLTENTNTEPKAFALLFQIDGDQADECYVLYNCKGTRPAVGGSTVEDSKEPETKTSTITAAPLSSGKVLARTTANTPDTVKSAWFTTVTVY